MRTPLLKKVTLLLNFMRELIDMKQGIREGNNNVQIKKGSL